MLTQKPQSHLTGDFNMKKIGKMFLSIFTLLAVLTTGLSAKFPALALELDATTTLVSQAQVAVETMNVSNDTTAADIITVVQDAIGEATATWSRDFYLQRAVNGAIVKVDGEEIGRTETRDGYISGTITITSVDGTANIAINLPITATYESLFYTATEVANPDDYIFGSNTYVPDSFTAKAAVVPETVTTVSNSTFKSFSSLEVLIVPDSVTNFDWAQCRDCPNLKVVILGDGITSMGGENFWNCTSLKYVRLPKNLVQIGENSFNGCSSLKDLILPSSVTTLKGSAFRGSGLYELILPSDLSTISSVWTCADMTNLRKIVVLGINKFSFEKFEHIGTDVEIVTWGGTAIASAAGSRFVDLATVNYTGSDILLTSSASGTTISLTPTPTADNEFAITYLAGTTESATVNTANKIFTLPSVGFIGCISYAVWTDTLESMVTDVRTALNALAVTNNTSAADIKASVEAAINNASLTVSWKQPFFRLRAVNGAIVRVDGVEKGRTDVRDGLVSGILTLTDGEESADIAFNLPIPAGYETYAYRTIDVAAPALYTVGSATISPTELTPKVVIIPDSVTTVSNSTFKSFSSLEVLIVPDSVTNFDWAQCRDCPNLKVVILGDGITSMGGENFWNCTSLKYVRLPKNLVQIGENSFNGCSSLKDLILPSSVTTLKGSAFRGSGLYELILPSDLSTISSVWTCADMMNLNKIVVLGVDKLTMSLFSQVGSTVKIVTWNDTSLAAMADSRFVDLASVIVEGESANAVSSLASSQVVLTVSPNDDRLIQLRYNTGDVTSNRYCIKNEPFCVPSANFIRIAYITADEAVNELEMLANKALRAMEITGATTADDVEAVVTSAMNCEDAVLSWDTAFNINSSTSLTDGWASGILKVAAYNRSFTLQIDEAVRNSSEGIYAEEPVSAAQTVDLYGNISGASDMTAVTLRNVIANKENLTATGETTFYISAQTGSDLNNGLTPSTAWKTLEAVYMHRDQIHSGDTILLARGGIYRGTIDTLSGVTYGAYGSGPKPCVYGSRENAAKGHWIVTDIPNVYAYKTYTNDIGIIVFDHGEAVGIKKLNGLAALKNNFDFFHDPEGRTLYLYLDKGNPADLYTDIEMGFNQDIVSIQRGVHDVTIENISFKYTGAHGISTGIGVYNICVQYCEFGWIGGSILAGTTDTRYGNAIQFWGTCSDSVIDHNWIYQVYDTALTHQYKGTDQNMVAKEMTYSNNLIEYCTYSFEYFWKCVDSSGNVITPPTFYMEDISVTNNIMRFSGYGWGNQRPDLNAAAHIKSWDSSPDPAKSFAISGNTFDTAWFGLIKISAGDSSSLPVLSGNTYIQQSGKKLGYYGVNGSTTELVFAENIVNSICAFDPNATVITTA